MRTYDPDGRRSLATPSGTHLPTPDGCPACRSPLIVTTSKTPTDDSYWRCRQCGEIWNASRRRVPPASVPWR